MQIRQRQRRVHVIGQSLGHALVDTGLRRDVFDTQQSVVKLVQSRLGLRQSLKGKIEWLVVMRGQEQQTQRFGRRFFQNFVNGVEIAERLAHLDAVDHQHAAVHPIVGKRVIRMRAHRLSALVFMVRKN